MDISHCTILAFSEFLQFNGFTGSSMEAYISSIRSQFKFLGLPRPLVRISGWALHVGKLVVTCRCPVVYSAVCTGFLHL